jgi:hypothetical protein
LARAGPFLSYLGGGDGPGILDSETPHHFVPGNLINNIKIFEYDVSEHVLKYDEVDLLMSLEIASRTMIPETS